MKPIEKGDTYRCAECDQEFISAWSQAEALAEKESTFHGVSLSECAVVCDDCYNQMMKMN